MNSRTKAAEVFLTAVALLGMYCALPKNAAPAHNSLVQTQNTVIVADGSDPMPLCRLGRKNCPK